MGVLLLNLSGPLQSWGAESRFNERKTRHEPTKSGVVGLLASALGRRREDDVADLACLPIAVRVDQAGHFERDFQTAHTRKFDKDAQAWLPDKSLPLSYRYYLADAVFVVGLKVPNDLLGEYADALTHPAFPLYLGRRSCPPSGRVLLGVREDVGLLQALAEEPWAATSQALLRKHQAERLVRLELLRDEQPGEDPHALSEMVRDAPQSFSQENRLYGWRRVMHQFVDVPNPGYIACDEHDPMSVLEEVE